MLFACNSCRAQLEVGDQEPGAHLRCFCGHLNIVPERAQRQVPMQHCSNCGGAIGEGQATCEFCEATIALGDRGWGEACPECLARMVKGAKYCGACGLEIRVQASLQRLKDRPCPRCQAALSLCQRDGMGLIECTICGGIWLPNEAFRSLIEARQRLTVADSIPKESKPDVRDLPPLKRHSVSYLPCPDCSQPMNRQNFSGASGVIIDWCRGHGYWFDLHELEHIQKFVDEGGIERARARRVKRDQLALERKARLSRSISIPTTRPLGRGSRSARPLDGWGSFILLDYLTEFIFTMFD